MIEDDIIREIRATREAFARAHGYDVRAMAAALRALDAAGDRVVVRLDPRPAEATVEPEQTPNGGAPTPQPTNPAPAGAGAI